MPHPGEPKGRGATPCEGVLLRQVQPFSGISPGGQVGFSAIEGFEVDTAVVEFLLHYLLYKDVLNP